MPSMLNAQSYYGTYSARFRVIKNGKVAYEGINCGGTQQDCIGGLLIDSNSSGGIPAYYMGTQKNQNLYECDVVGLKVVHVQKNGNEFNAVPTIFQPQGDSAFIPKYYFHIEKDGVVSPNSPLVFLNQIFPGNIIPIGNLSAGNYQITVGSCEVPDSNTSLNCNANQQFYNYRVKFTVLPTTSLNMNGVKVKAPLPDQPQDCKTVCFDFNIEPNYDTIVYDYGDGYVTPYQSDCYTYENEGTYTVSVKATYPDCGTKTSSVTFYVGTPTVSLSKSPEVFCASNPLPVTLKANTNANPNQVSFLWSNGATNVSSTTIYPPFTTLNYHVTVTNANNPNCNSVASSSITPEMNCCGIRPYLTPCSAQASPTYYDVKLSEIFDNLCVSGNTLNFNNFPSASTSTLGIKKRLIVDGNYVLIGNPYKNIILLGEDAKIIIPVGNSLTLQNMRLQPCETFWSSIEVHGLGTGNAVRQLENSVGKLVLNNCEIFNAKNAITTSEKFPNGTFNVSSTGGIVQAKNTTFTDCSRATEFLSYHNLDAFGLNEQPNRSKFENCSFITTTAFKGYAVNHITLWDVNGVQIKGCRFEDQRTQLPLHQKGTGIFSIGASFTVERANNAVGSPGFNIKSKFTGLQNGIRSIAPTSNPAKFSIYVRDAEFDCWKNIYLNGSDFARIHSNKFLVKGSGIKPGYGVHVEQCSGYTIENNDFWDGSTAGTPQNKIAAGVVVRNMHGNPTDVYRNRFNGLLASAIAVGDNNNANDISSGHQFRCNDLTNTTYDFYVTRDLNLPNNNPGIARNQGLPNGNTAQLAGNLFGGSTRHFQNNDDVNFVDYWHHDPASNPRVAPDPNKVSNNFKAHAVFGRPLNSSSCPNRFVKGYDIRVMDVKDLIGFINKKYLIKMMVDGGNTDWLKHEVASTPSPEAFEMYTNLMNEAGLISAEVAKEVIEKESVFSNAMVRDILVANPHVVKHKELNNWLDARTNPLPLYMRLQIDLGTENISQKELMEAEAAGLYKAVADNVTSSLLDFMDSDAVYNPDSAAAWLSSLHTLSDEMKLALTLYAEGNEQAAFAIIEAAENGFADEKPTAKEDMQQYVELHELMRKFTPNSKHPAFLDSADLENLKPLAYSDELYSPLAKGLLALNNALDYEEPVPLPGMESFKKESATNNEKRRLLEELLGNSLQIYPNPAADFTTIEFANAGKEKTSLKLTDLQGKTVWKQQSKWNQNEVIVPLKDLQNGVYIISVMDGNKTIASKNLIVQK